jgi:predicted nucleic acid-binding protein
LAIVLDASALVDFLVREGNGEWVEQQLATDADVHAPHLIDVEAANALRNLVVRGVLDSGRARAALAEVPLLRIKRYPHTPFLDEIWALRETLTAYDAAYIVLAEALDAPLVTTDERLARTPIPVRVLAP